MALDEALLAEFMEKGGAPVFRTYTWQVPTVSLGRFQELGDDLDPERVLGRGTPLVRRMTGGGAIYHAHELTYSLICRQEDLETASVKDSFKKLCRFLIRSYRRLGIEAGYAVDLMADPAGLGRKTAFCFAGRELYDILCGSRKLGGNAQRRLHRTIFQHGSIPFSLDWPALRELFLPGILPPASEITSLTQEGWTGTTATLASILADEFSAELGLRWQDSVPSKEEAARAAHFQQKKYENPDWTYSKNEE